MICVGRDCVVTETCNTTTSLVTSWVTSACVWTTFVFWWEVSHFLCVYFQQNKKRRGLIREGKFVYY
jgi:hypothetical protein